VRGRDDCALIWGGHDRKSGAGWSDVESRQVLFWLC
jgi:hypothetical protein